MYELTPSTTFEPSIMQRWESFKFGYDLYVARECVSRCMNSEQRRGWYAALSAEVESLTPGYAQKVGW